ncbi:MAG: tetratricopeptide repeat protein [Opitutaceae bacterium]|jgi:Flp pilus assembly protein TadD
MSIRPTIFISAVSKELKSARQLVANTLQFLGYEPVWQDVFGTGQGDLRAMLREKIDGCKGVVQLVGGCYGAESGTPDETFGRVSYTQYEALYARQQGKKVWYLLLDTKFPRDPHEAEPEELQKLHAAYRLKLQQDMHLFHPLASEDALKTSVLQMRDELNRLRRGLRLWAAGVLGLLVIIAAVVSWMVAVQESRRVPETTQAETAFVSKDFAKAFEIYGRLSAKDPGNVAYHRRIEECARNGWLATQFLDRYLAAVAKEPQRAILHNYLGNAYLMIDDKDRDGKARAEYEAALRLDPQSVLPLANLAIITYRAGKIDEAEALFKRYVTGQPNDAQGWVNLGLFEVAKVEKNATDAQASGAAEQSLRKALQVEPALASAYKGLGRLWAALSRKAEALNAYQRSLALNYEQPVVRQQIELLAWESDTRLSGAQADDLKTRSISPGASDAPPVVTAMQLLDQRRFQQALEVCREWSKREPNNPLAFRLLGRAYEGQNRDSEASTAFAKANQLSKLPD